MANSPEAALLLAEERVREAIIEERRKAKWGVVDVGLGAAKVYDQRSFVVTLSTKLPAWGVFERDLEIARLEQLLAKREGEVARRELMGRLVRFLEEAKEASNQQHRLAVARKVALELVDLARQSYEAGRSTLMDIILARNSLLKLATEENQNHLRLIEALEEIESMVGVSE